MSDNISTLLPDGREPFLAFVCDDAALDALQSVATQIGWRAESCKKGGLRAAVQTLSVAMSPAMLLVDLSESTDPLADVDSLAEVCEPGTLVFAVGRINDVALYRELVLRGIHDYLVKPISAGQLTEVLERGRTALTAPRTNADEHEPSHFSAAIVGVRGGAGASMLATSLAWLLSTDHGKSTALLDLDVHFGTGALTLDLEPGRGLADAIEDPARIDGLFIERAMVRASDKLAIMSAEAPLSTNLMTDGSAFQRLEQEFAQGFDATIIDMPRSILLNFPQLLAGVDCVVLVTELTLAAARDSIRILAWLKSHAPHTRTIIVANKVQPGSGEISHADFAAAIECPVSLAIPYDAKAAVLAARLGQTFAQANRSGKCVLPLVELARKMIHPGEQSLADRNPRSAKPSLFGSIDLKAFLRGKAKSAPAATA